METANKDSRSLKEAGYYQDGYLEALSHVTNILDGMGMIEKCVEDAEKAHGFNIAVDMMKRQVEGLSHPSSTPGISKLL